MSGTGRAGKYPVSGLAQRALTCPDNNDGQPVVNFFTVRMGDLTGLYFLPEHLTVHRVIKDSPRIYGSEFSDSSHGQKGMSFMAVHMVKR